MTVRRKQPPARKWFLAGASTLSLLTATAAGRGQAPPGDLTGLDPSIWPAAAEGAQRQPYCPPVIVSPYCPIPFQPGQPGQPGQAGQPGQTPEGGQTSPNV